MRLKSMDGLNKQFWIINLGGSVGREENGWEKLWHARPRNLRNSLSAWRKL